MALISQNRGHMDLLGVVGCRHACGASENTGATLGFAAPFFQSAPVVWSFLRFGLGCVDLGP